MSKIFNAEDIEKISELLGVNPQLEENSWTYKLSNSETRQNIVFTIYNNVVLPNDKSTSIISVQTNHGYFELHNCSNLIFFEPDEVIFVEADETNISSLVIGKTATCSLFSNIKRHLLKENFTDLDAPLLLSAMQLSIIDSMLE